jgi:hypothetical protein
VRKIINSSPVEGAAVKDVHRLIAAIRKRRGKNTVVAFASSSAHGPVEPTVLDRFVERVGLSGIGDQWREVSREAAVSLVAAVLAQDLAYSSVQHMPPAEARSLAERFAGKFADDARFFTNTDLEPGASSCSWDPMTESTIDAGVVGIDARTIGILVVQDED